MDHNFDENMLRRLLLGALSDDEQSAVEDAVFVDADLRSRLETAENDLIDEYSRGELDREEKAQFEKMFLNSPERLEKIEFAVALTALPEKSKVKYVEEKSNFWDSLKAFFLSPQIGFAFILLFILVLGALYWLNRQTDAPNIARQNNQNLNAEPIKMNTANDSAPTPVSANENTASNFQKPNGNESGNNKSGDSKNAVVSSPTPGKTPTETAPTFATLVFPSGLLRDGGNQKFTLNLSKKEPQARLIFNLEKGDNLPLYLIQLQARDGKIISSSRVPRRNRQISLILSAAKLTAGFYTATISGIAADGTSETLGFFDFEVIKP